MRLVQFPFHRKDTIYNTKIIEPSIVTYLLLILDVRLQQLALVELWLRVEVSR